jgi:hypothetical protein
MMLDDIQTEELFRQQVPFFGSCLEEFLARYWYGIFLYTCAILVWQTQIRKTCSTALESGIISNDNASVATFRNASCHFQKQVARRFRFVPIAAIITVTVIANRDQILWLASRGETANLKIFRLATVLSFSDFLIAVGAFGSVLRWKGSTFSQTE